MLQYLYPLLGTFIESFSTIMLKNYVTNKQSIYLYIGILGYALTGLFFTYLLRYYNLLSSNIIWHLIHFSILFVYGLYYSNDTYSYKEILGIMLGILSFILLSNQHH